MNPAPDRTPPPAPSPPLPPAPPTPSGPPPAVSRPPISPVTSITTPSRISKNTSSAPPPPPTPRRPPSRDKPSPKTASSSPTASPSPPTSPGTTSGGSDLATLAPLDEGTGYQILSTEPTGDAEQVTLHVTAPTGPATSSAPAPPCKRTDQPARNTTPNGLANPPNHPPPPPPRATRCPKSLILSRKKPPNSPSNRLSP